MKSIIAAILIGGLTLGVLSSISSSRGLWSIWLILSGMLATFVYRKMSKVKTAAAKKKALNRFEKAVKLDPSRAAAYYERGEYHLERREFERASDDFTEALRLGNSELDYKFYLERGWALPVFAPL